MTRAIKGMVLAAGLGTRLRPLTDIYPKPLVPFAGSTPLELALANLMAAGVDDVAINSHYHPEQIARLVQENPLGQRLVLSYEPELLGTGGAYPPLRSWLGDADLIVLNGDVVSDFDLKSLIARHRAMQAAASMMLLPAVIQGESSVFHHLGRIHAIGKAAPKAATQAGNFACAQILSPKLLDLLPKSGTFDVVSKGYLKALDLGWTVAADVHGGYWHDLRTPQFYWSAILALLREPDLCRAIKLDRLRQTRGLIPLPDANGVLLPTALTTYNHATLGPHVVVESGVQIGAGAQVSNSVLLPGAVVPAGATIDHALVGPGIHIALAQSD